jgi:hypothetical protein
MEVRMHLVLLLLAMALLVAPRLAAAADDAKPLNLQIRPKLLSAPASAPAPFATPVEDGHPLDLSPAPSHHEGSRSACGIDSTWCYDASSGGGHLVYKPARRYMPHFDGLTPENISVKRDRIVFRYSFR